MLAKPLRSSASKRCSFWRFRCSGARRTFGVRRSAFSVPCWRTSMRPQRSSLSCQTRWMDQARGTELDTILIGGREPRAIVIVDYNDTWPAKAASMAHKIQGSLGPAALSVEHIGSTSVSGLAAKPVIDMLLVVADIDDEESYLVPLESIGLRLRV
ncbi:GrpB family protein [Cryobacterium breve]|uniref:GrpB family protein n=1 Tax=Cryobacterium breve TaxID=1259258 RepID=A0ABY2J1G5_9MICO|nr:GrpB family protein [Cryobacterium sp. TmT3-12]TFC97451.1 GrpB family protein [Cryobacterium breve]